MMSENLDLEFKVIESRLNQLEKNVRESNQYQIAVYERIKNIKTNCNDLNDDLLALEKNYNIRDNALASEINILKARLDKLEGAQQDDSVSDVEDTEKQEYTFDELARIVNKDNTGKSPIDEHILAEFIEIPNIFEHGFPCLGGFLRGVVRLDPITKVWVFHKSVFDYLDVEGLGKE